MGISQVTHRSANNYMALARFRATTGKRFPEFLTLSVSRLYPIFTLPDSVLADFAVNGVPVEGGGTKPISKASVRDFKRAASAVRRQMESGAPAPVNVFQRAFTAIKNLGPLTAQERAKLTELLETAPADAPAVPSPAPAEALTGAATPVAAAEGLNAVQ